MRKLCKRTVEDAHTYKPSASPTICFLGSGVEETFRLFVFEGSMKPKKMCKNNYNDAFMYVGIIAPVSVLFYNATLFSLTSLVLRVHGSKCYEDASY